ncbi:MAG: ATP-binding protein [Cyanothece sp. SIO1E1]|nr:ATP-binding protein [Cyanothece sp. SIO1E1]
MNSAQPKRRRGVVLTPQARQKLQAAIDAAENQENFGEKYTLEDLSGRTGLDSGTVSKVLDREEGVDRRTLERFFHALNLQLSGADYRRPGPIAGGRAAIQNSQSSGPNEVISEAVAIQSQVDWGEAPDVPLFYGRQSELEQLEDWIITADCRLIALLGMGGIGKTALSVTYILRRIPGSFYDPIILLSLGILVLSPNIPI